MSAAHRLVLYLALLLPLPVSAAAPDWKGFADVDTVVVLTRDDDGAPRETTVWLAVLDGQGYIRTGGTHWGANVKRDPDITLRIGDADFALRAEFVEDEALREKVEQVFRDKYGFEDSIMSILRGSAPSIMRLTSR